MKIEKRLTKAEIKKRLLEEWENTMRDGFGLSSAEANRLVKSMTGKRTDQANNPPGALHLNAGMALFVGNTIRNRIYGTKIKTEKQLEAALQEIREVREKMPTVVRRALKAVSNMLPRRGGPGRQPKLNRNEASKACDHIAMFIRQKHTLKEALQMMSDSSPSILGKKVGARTLQKAWDRRDKLTSE